MKKKSCNGRTGKMASSGFTLIELLVVISIIAVLMAIMMPALGKVRAQGKKIVCSAHCKSIMTSMLLYTQDYKTFFPASNGSKWFDLGKGTSRSGDMLEPTHTSAYWGIAYEKYGAKKELFKCPAKKRYEGHWNVEENGDEEAFIYSDLGLNGYVCWKEPDQSNNMVYSPGKGWRRVEEFKRPSETIVMHDHWEPMMDDNGDMYYINEKAKYKWQENGKYVNIAQWKTEEFNKPAYYTGAVQECWRHDDSSNIVWLDGHMSNQKRTDGEDFKYVWYTGGVAGLR